MQYIAPCAACDRPMLVDAAHGRCARLRCPSCGNEADFEVLEALAVPLPPAAILIEQALEQQASDVSTCVAESDGLCETNVAVAADFERPADAPLDCIAGAAGDACSIDGDLVSTTAAEDFVVVSGALSDSASDAICDNLGAPFQVATDSFPDLVLDGSTSGESRSLVLRGRRRGNSVGVLAGQLAGIVLGGVAGLTIGYVLLLWMKGPRADFLDVRDRWRSMVDYVESWRVADPPSDRLNR